MRVQQINFNPNGVMFLNKKQEHAALNRALEELKKIEIDNNDLIYTEAIGAKPPFKNGEEAYEFIKNNNIEIKYGKIAIDDVHATYYNPDRSIIINEKYKNSASFSEILAIAEAIFHEAGHAKDLDRENSIQEELDCLALNALAHRFHKKKYPDIFLGQNSFLFSQGVALYEKLFYEFDPKKESLKKRITEKYGFLPSESKGHPESKFVKGLKTTPN